MRQHGEMLRPAPAMPECREGFPTFPKLCACLSQPRLAHSICLVALILSGYAEIRGLKSSLKYKGFQSDSVCGGYVLGKNLKTDTLKYIEEGLTRSLDRVRSLSTICRLILRGSRGQGLSLLSGPISALYIGNLKREGTHLSLVMG